MLFNTLAYAQFFGFVFVVSWTLVHRRFAPLLPWFALAAFAATHPTLQSLGLTAVAGALTAALLRAPVTLSRQALVATVINGVALGWLTVDVLGLDPVSAGLATLGLPLRDALGAPWRWALAALGLAAAVTLIAARKVRLLFLLGASYVFYAHWDWRFLPLIWGSSTADWLLAHAIARSPTARRKRLWLIATVVMNLGVLGFFKYFNFGVDSLSALLESAGLPGMHRTLSVALPVGISFFTFESMSYVIDVYRGELEPQKSYFEYLAFVAFFPHLVAGPIVRPRDLLPQLAGKARFNADEASEGLFLIAVGLMKKVVIGDYLAVNLVDRVFDAPMMYSSVECYAAIVGYALLIYCDFSGYTDIAIGSALLLGVRFPKNFDAPYKAHNIQDFWRRWHISLSTWLRDYLYIPLGGNRKGKLRTYVNLLLTMLLGGLWHGAAWTFVVWGGLHGAALALHKAFTDLRKRRGSTGSSPLWQRLLGGVVTFHFVCACWVFFRAPSFGQAQLMFTQLAQLTTHHVNLAPSVLAVLALGLGSHFMPEGWYTRVRGTFTTLPAPVQGIALFAVAVALRQMASADAVPFVYFQF